MKRRQLLLWVVVICLVRPAAAAETRALRLDTYSGYFVSNQFEPNAAQSFRVLTDQAQFDKVFGIAAVMGDRSHRLAKDAFASSIVIATVKRGPAVWTYKVESITERRGVVTLRYTATAKTSDSATFACPLIVSIPKGAYRAVRFVENEQPIKRVDLPRATNGSGHER
jgi:hypothetical protein